MPQGNSKLTDASADQEALSEAVQDLKVTDTAEANDGNSSGEDEIPATNAGAGPEAAKSKKKKSKKKKLKDALTSSSSTSSSAAAAAQAQATAQPAPSAESPLPANALNSLSDSQISKLVAANPALAQSILGSSSAAGQSDQRKLREALKALSAADLVTGMSSGKNAKDMASYKFWSTQPVPKFDEATAAAAAAAAPAKKEFKEGPIREDDIEKVSKTPAPLVEGFEWCEVDLDERAQLDEVQDLLCNHYVEDDEAMFRFNYLHETLTWALKAPGWRKSWHIGVRASKSRKLVAFISGIPVTLRVRANTIKTAAEINFLCIHKKLRSKRLAPVLIMEITRRCNLEGTFQAIYTVGSVLPKPVAACRYFHRALDWEKLYNVGFSPLPHGSTKTRQILKYKLPDRTATPGLRLMESRDVPAVHDLLNRYLSRVAMAQEYSPQEVEHWLLDKETDPKSKKRVVWTYVVEDGQGKVTDFFSFYCLESSVLHSGGGHSVIRAAYLFYYGSESAWVPQQKDEVLRTRLNALVKDALVLAKQAKFDVFNALTLLDNPLFLTEQKFGAGDGQLYYYLFNYRTQDLPSGVDARNMVDDTARNGVGVVML